MRKGGAPGPTPVPMSARYVEDANGCWIWTGAVGKHGYGTVKRQNQTRMAHRVMYEETIGPVPEGLVMDHLCSVKRCIRPSHLEPVTHQINLQRAWDRRHCPGCTCQ